MKTNRIFILMMEAVLVVVLSKLNLADKFIYTMETFKKDEAVPPFFKKG